MVRRCNSVSVARLAGKVLSLLSATEHTLTFLKHSLIFGSVWQTQITCTEDVCFMLRENRIKKLNTVMVLCQDQCSILILDHLQTLAGPIKESVTIRSFIQRAKCFVHV